MAFNRCFNTYNNSIQTASDYMASLRQNTIYTDVATNIENGSGNPVKKDGYQYNDNFGTIPLTISNKYGCLVNAKSYDLLLDVTKGMMIHNTDLGFNSNVLNNNEAWDGNFFSVEYANKGVNVVVDTSYNAGNTNEIIFPQPISAHDADLSFNNAYPGVIVDPCYNIFYNPCLLSYNDGKNPWIRLVDNLEFENTFAYKQAINSDPLYGMNYPQKVLFVCDPSENIFNI